MFFGIIQSHYFDISRTASATVCQTRYDVKVKVVAHPRTQDLYLAKVLHALSDPVRLKLVRMLAAERDLPCGALCLGRPKSSMSHHFKTMIDAGLLRVDVAGNIHLNNLRLDDLEARFPGLIVAVLRADETIPQGLERQENRAKKKRGVPGADRV